MDTYQPEVDGEGPEVGDHPGTEQHVSGDVDVELAQGLGHLGPPVLLSPQPANQLLCAHKLLRAELDVLLELLLLGVHLLELVVESLQLVRHLQRVDSHQ